MSSEMKALMEANQQFACALYQQIQKNSTGNLFFSPLSLSTVLSMTLAGAREETETQILNVLGLKEIGPEVHGAYRNMLNRFAQNETVRIANALFIQDRFDVIKPFLDIVEKMYSAKIENVDFENDSESSAVKVNEWVASATKGKIVTLVDRFEENTVMLIINAICFKSFWAKPFYPGFTKKGCFHISREETVNVQLMFQFGKFRYTSNKAADCEILELPYRDMNISMLIFLPKTTDGLSKIESLLSRNFLSDVISSLKKRSNFGVSVPSFKLEETYSLSSHLSEMGMIDVFTSNLANLQGISDMEGLFVRGVLHKSFIEVNEEGTEAAAVSLTPIDGSCSEEPRYLPFKVDHPFLFCILDCSSNCVLFLGRLKKPNT